MKVATPPLMKVASPQLFEKKVRARRAYKDFLDSTKIVSEVVREMVTTHITFLDDRISTYWIGGSQAWQAALAFWREHGLNPIQSPTEESAFVAGNADVFFVHHNLDTCIKFLEMFESYIVPWLQEQCDARLATIGSPYKIKISRNGFDAPKTRSDVFDVNDPVTYTLFPGYNYIFELSEPQLAATRSAVSATQGEFNGKMVLYIDISYAEGVDLRQLKQAYIGSMYGLNFPNEQGLLTYGMLIPTSRAMEKGFDVDTLRKDVLLRVMQSRGAQSIPHIYHDMVTLYRQIFFGSAVYVDDFVNRVFMINMKLMDPNIEAGCASFEAFLIEMLRPTINAFIVETSMQISQKWTRNPNSAFMFLAGGDAMRRYKKDITVTKDIDTKIYIKEGVPSIQTEVERIVAKNMSKLVCYMISHKNRLFASAGTEQVNYDTPLLRCYIKFLTQSDRNMQFRLRLIQKNENLPVTLYSIDFRCYFVGEFGGKQFSIQYDVPIVDVVIQENEGNKITRAEAVEMRHTNGIPVATKKFLVQDIIHTYENDDLAAMRSGVKKVGKDKERFNALRALPKSSPIRTASPIGVAGNQPAYLNSVNNEYFSYNSPSASAYYKHFVSLRQKKKTVFKYKMPFSATKLASDSEGKVQLEFDAPIYNKAEDLIDYMSE